MDPRLAELLVPLEAEIRRQNAARGRRLREVPHVEVDRRGFRRSLGMALIRVGRRMEGAAARGGGEWAAVEPVPARARG